MILFEFSDFPIVKSQKIGIVYYSWLIVFEQIFRLKTAMTFYRISLVSPLFSLYSYPSNIRLVNLGNLSEIISTSFAAWGCLTSFLPRRLVYLLRVSLKKNSIVCEIGFSQFVCCFFFPNWIISQISRNGAHLRRRGIALENYSSN